MIDAVLGATDRARANVSLEMRRGVNSLATVASLAPLLGVLMTARGVVCSFPGFAGQAWQIRSIIFNNLASSLAWTCVGLVVGILALFCYRYLQARLETIAFEAKSGSIELANLLARNSWRPVRISLCP